jgi:hypothetical protein
MNDVSLTEAASGTAAHVAAEGKHHLDSHNATQYFAILHSQDTA